MKKIIFIAQVITLTIALPVLSILELNHGRETMPLKQEVKFVIGGAVQQPGADHSITTKQAMSVAKASI